MKPPRTGWRRRLIPALWTTAILAVVLLCTLLFAPLPISWAINYAARRALPPEFGATVGAGTLRWRAGADTARVELTTLAATIGGRPLASIERVEVEIDKAAAWHGYYAPRLVVVTAPHLIVDTTPQGAFAALPRSSATAPDKSAPSAPSPAGPPPPALLALAPALPAPGGETRVKVDDLRVDYIFPGLRWGLQGALGLKVARRADDLQLDATADLGAPGHSVGGSATAEVSLRTGHVRAAITLPEFKTADLPPLPSGALPFTGVLAFTGGIEADTTTHTLLAAKFDFAVRDGHLTVPGLAGPPVSIERIALRGSATRRETGGVASLWGQLEQGTIVADGAQIELPKLEGTLGPRSQIAWTAEISQMAGARLVARLPDALRTKLPWLAAALEASALTHLSSSGTAGIDLDATGTLQPRTIEATQHVQLAIGDATLAIEAKVKQREAVPIEASLHVARFEPAKFARALPADWPIAAAVFPVEIRALAHTTPAGELLDADADVTIGRGELRANAMLPIAVPIWSATIAARVREKGARLELPTLAITTGLGQFLLRELVVQRDARNARITGRAEVTRVELAPLAGALPAASLAMLRDFGLTPSDLALRRAAAEFVLEVKSSDGADWQPTKADATADLEAAFTGKPLALHATAKLPEGAAEATAQVKLAEFRPADFGPRVVSGVELADFEFPVNLTADLALLVRETKIKSAALHLRLGAGEARLAALGATVPLRGVSVEADFSPGENLVRVSAAQLDLANGIAAGVERTTIALAPKLRIAGTAKLAPLALADALAWWPTTLLPDVRKQAIAAAPVGKLSTDGIEFEVVAQGEKGEGALAPTKARGTIALSGWSANIPGVPGATSGDEARVALDFPRATVEIKNLRAPGFALDAARVTIADVTAARPATTLQATFALDAAAAAPWLATLPPSPALAAAAKSTGRVRGEFNASGSVALDDFSGAKANLTLVAEKLTVPGFFDGPFQAKFDLAAPTRTTLTATVIFTLAEAKVLALDRRTGVSPLTLTIALHDWLAGDKPTADVALAAADFGGVPLRASMSAQFADHAGNVARAELKEFVFGHTELHGAWQHVSAAHDTIALSSPRIDVNELLHTAAPWLAVLSPPSPPVPGAKAAAVAPGAAKPIAATQIEPARIDLAIDVAELAFGGTRRLHGLMAKARLDDNWPQAVHFTATEDEEHAIALDLATAGGKQHLTLALADAAALARTLTEPLRLTPLPPGALADTAKSAATLPTLLAGGAVSIEADITRGPTGLAAKGNFSLRNATMIHAPRMLQLLALRSGKKLEHDPLIRRLAIGEWSIDPETIFVSGFALDGSGLIDRVKLNSIRYTLAGEKIAVDGDYFGVGFEVVGTRADPQVFLKENAVIRAVGQRNEFDFFGDDAAAPAPAAKAATAPKTK